VSSRNFVNILRAYNHKQPRAWDEKFISIQHYYNRVLHASIDKSLFENYFGYMPRSPLYTIYEQPEVVEIDSSYAMMDLKGIGSIGEEKRDFH
jgi:hypothetical protein